MISFHRAILALLSFTLSTVASAGSAAAAPSGTTPAAIASLTGIVTDTAGAPLADVRVTILEANRSTSTGPEGRFSFSQLSSGTYGVSFARVGFAPVVRRVTVDGSDVTISVAMRRTLVELPSLQVTATPIATTALTAPQPTSVISASDLAAAQAPTLGETLEGLAGVRNLSTGQGVGKPVIRGLTGNRVLVLADGQRLENAQWGDEHGPNVGTATAERIEVIRGPASVLYGSDAIGGVINVVERELPDAIGGEPFVSGTVSAAYATNGSAPQGSAVLEGGAGRVGWRATMSGLEGDDVDTPAGPLANSGLWTASGSGSIGYRGSWGSVATSVTHRQEKLEIHEDPAEEPDATPFQRVGDTRVSLEANVPLGLSRFQLDAGWERNRRREFEEAGAADVALGLETESWTANGHLHHRPLGSFEGIVGASFQRSALDRFGEETLVPAHESWAYGVYGYEQLEIGRWHLSFGARADRRVLDVEETDELAVEAQRRAWNSFTGNAGAVYRLAEPVSLVLNLGRGYRAPSAFDLFANGVHEGTIRYERGNPDLANETSFNTDLAVRMQTNRLGAEVGTFYNRIDGYIYPDPTGLIDPESGFQIYDITQGDARLVGIETALDWHPTALLHFSGNADYTHGTNLTTDEPLAFVPPLRVAGQLKLEPEAIGGFTNPYLSVGVEANARQSRPDPEEFAPAGYALVSLGAGLVVPTGNLLTAIDLSVNNLLDTEYRGFMNRYKLYALDPGRNVVLRVTTRF